MEATMERIVPISELASQAKRIVESVRKTRDSVIITQRGRAAALLVNYEDYEGMLATLEEMSERNWRERLVEAERDSRAGRGTELDEFRERRTRRTSGKKGRAAAKS
jgi:prevent-host-death family protein